MEKINKKSDKNAIKLKPLFSFRIISKIYLSFSQSNPISLSS